MAERREPGLDLDQLDDSVPTLEPTRSVVKAQSVPSKSRSGVGTALIALLILILMGVAAGLGYWGVQLKKELDEQRILIEQMNLWLESTDASLTQANNTVSQSGETLRGRLEQLDTRLEDRIKHFDSEIAKLWTIAYQRNKPQLDAQAKQIAALTEANERQVSATEALKDQLAQQQNKAESLAARNEAFSVDLQAQQSALADIEGQITPVQEALDRLNAQQSQLQSDLEFQLSVERDARAKLQADLQTAQAGQGATAALERRISELEQLIEGIDASRRSLTAKLLELQNQINNR